jgi:hypothetical protein
MKLVKLNYKYINIDAITYIESSSSNRAVIYFLDGQHRTLEWSLEQTIEEK